ncbi:FAD-dependent urate hydroxylase [Morella rubra]|uniref:FAD-dependent urate hydroxylase n=1 Tax=Morella rubra TaxID=262757 RepID=A0A6A1VCC9_9ROSI|nr:FAD-dependent urate hydroxylase [Morella rubra]
MEEADVVIVGAGIAGLAAALALKIVGVRALVLERGEGLRTTGAALGLSINAWVALDVLGVGHKLTAIYASCSKRAREFSAVHRKALLEALAEDLPSGTIRFSSKVKSIENQSQEGSEFAVIRMDNGASIKAKALIGCDGVHSVVARWLGLRPAVDAGRWAVRGLALFPEGHGQNPVMRQFVSAGERAGFVPLNDKELYWFLTYVFSSKGEDIPHDPELIKREVIDHLAKDLPPEYLSMVEHSELSTVTWSELLYRRPWDVIFGTLSKGNVTVAGDAMHAMTPDLGQGGCSALEDAVVLGRHIGDLIIRNKRPVAGDQLAEAFRRYANERRWRVAGLITASYLSGWVQVNNSGWLMKFLRDMYSISFFTR